MLMISTRVSAVGTDQKDRQKEATHASITTGWELMDEKRIEFSHLLFSQ